MAPMALYGSMTLYVQELPFADEHFFGVLKRQFHILTLVPEFDMEIQARLLPALCALHNFILRYDPDDLEEMLDISEELEHGDDNYGNLASGPSTREAQE